MANVLTTVGTLNAYEHVPTTTSKLPVLVFLPGIGQTGTDASLLLTYGPNYFIQNGWNPEDMIYVSVQPTVQWANPAYVDTIVENIKTKYADKYDGRIFLTGLSAGAYAIDNYLGKDSAYSKKITAVVAMSAPEPETYFVGTNFTTPAWGICGSQDSWYTKMYNLYTGLSKKFTTFSGGHCCWNTYYDPTWTENGTNIYSWLLTNTAPETSDDPETTGPKEVVLTTNTDGGITTTATKLGLNAGDTLVLKGNYNYINIDGITGTEDSRITIVADGDVTIGGNQSYAGRIANSSYFDILPTTTRGTIKVNGGTLGYDSVGLALNKCNNFTARYLDITNVSVGIMMKTTPSADSSTYGDEWAYENILFEYNNIHDTTGEGFYLGHSNSNVESVTIDGVATNVYAFRLKNVTVQYNTLLNTGWDGIQLTCGDGILIQNNTVTNYGTKAVTYQNFGIICAGNDVKILNNIVSLGNGTGITGSFNGPLEIGYNQVLSAYGDGQDAIYVNSTSIKSYDKCTPSIHDNYVEHAQRNWLRVANTNDFMYAGTIANNKYKDALSLIDNSGSTLINNIEVIDDNTTDPEEPTTDEPTTDPVTVATAVAIIMSVLMSDGTIVEINRIAKS